jgi:hypothetical protein
MTLLSFTADQAVAFRLARQHLGIDRSADVNALRERQSAAQGARSAPPSRRRRIGEPRRSAHEQGASGGGKAFASTGSAKASAERVVDVVRATGGIQAQVMSAAETSIWTRRPSTTRDEIRDALWQKRDVVRT